MELFKECFCPLFLVYALVLLIIGVKAAFLTHGMNKKDLFFGVLVMTIAGGYFANNTEGLIVSVLFNLIAPGFLLKYLGAERKPLITILLLFGIGTVAAYWVFGKCNLI